MLTPSKFSPIGYLKGDCYDKLTRMSLSLSFFILWLDNIHHLITYITARLWVHVIAKNICFVSCSHTFHTHILPCGVLTNSHLPCYTRNSLTIIIMSDFSFSVHGKVQLSSLVMLLMHPTPTHKLMVTYKLPPAIHIRSLWLAPAVVCYVTRLSESCLSCPAFATMPHAVKEILSSGAHECSLIHKGKRVSIRHLWLASQRFVCLSEMPLWRNRWNSSLKKWPENSKREMMKYIFIFTVNF